MIKIDEDQTTIHLTRGDATHSDFNRRTLKTKKKLNMNFKQQTK